MSETPQLLPLGSAVQIIDDDTVYVIIARGFQKQAEGYLAGYKTIPYPQGAASGVREVVIRGSQIEKVIHLGHADAADEAFVKDQLEYAKSPPKQQTPTPEPDLTVDLTAPATISASPTPAESAAETLTQADTVQDPRDPFKQLRDKGKLS